MQGVIEEARPSRARKGAQADAQSTPLEVFFTHFLDGTFLELIHRLPTGQEAYVFGQIACDWLLHAGPEDAPLDLGCRKYVRDQILWGPERGSYAFQPVVQQVHWEHVWMSVNRMITQLIMGYVNDLNASPFDQDARYYVAGYLLSLIRRWRQGVRDMPNEEKEATLLDCKAAFGRQLRLEVAKRLGCDPFNPRSTDEFLVITHFYDWYVENPDFVIRTKTDTISRHPVEICGGWDAILQWDPDWVCKQLVRMIEAGIDMFTKEYFCAPHEWGFSKTGSGRPDHLLHYPSHFRGLCTLRQVWLDLWGMGYHPPPFCRGLDFGPFDEPYMPIPGTVDLSHAEARQVLYAGLRAFYELIPACMLAVLRKRTDDNGQPVTSDFILVNTWWGPGAWPAVIRYDGERPRWFSEDLDRRFAADFFGLKPWMSVMRDWCYSNPETNQLMEDKPIFDQDYYQWVPGPDPKAEIEAKIGQETKVFPICPGYDDTMTYRLSPSVHRHDYGKHLIRDWLTAWDYAASAPDPGVCRVFLQTWDEVWEGLCLTDTLEYRKFYIKAIPQLKQLTKLFYGRPIPSPGEEEWVLYAKCLVYTAYRAVFGFRHVLPRHREQFDALTEAFVDQHDNPHTGQPWTKEDVFFCVCEHPDNLRRWPPVLSLEVDPNNDLDDENPSFIMRASYYNFGPAKWLSWRFMIYFPLRIRYDPENPQDDHVIRVAAYLRPIACGTTEPYEVLVALCPNRLEFAWLFEHTGDEYGSAPKDFYVRVVKNDILAFFRRALAQMRAGGQYDAYEGIDLGNPDHGDDTEVIDEGPNRPPAHDEVPENTANAPFHATFSAHFAEGSQRFWEGDLHNRDTWIRIPITDGNEVWYGDRD